MNNSSQPPLASNWPHTVALTAALIMVASINVVWWRLNDQVTEQTTLVNHTHQVIDALEETLVRAGDLVIGQRGYALTHETDFLGPYFNATNRIPVLTWTLRSLLRDNPKQAANLDQLEPMLVRYQLLNRQHIAALSRGDPLTPDLEFRRNVRDSSERIHSLVERMVTEEGNLLAQRQTASDRATVVVIAVNALAVMVSISVIILVFSALRRENILRRKSERALQLSYEELEFRVRERTVSLLQSEAERKRLEQEILETSDMEMNRIGHDLHDGVGQQLTALSLFTSGLEKEASGQAPQLVDFCKRIGSELREVIRQVRILSHGLSPASLEENGLVEALRKLANDMRSSNTDCLFVDVSEVPVNDPHLAAQLYRIGQEAVTNATKHSDARRVCISLKCTPILTELKVKDDGRGFSQTELNGKTGLGLRAMKYRADVIGAYFEIDSAPGKGTAITCRIQRQN